MQRLSFALVLLIAGSLGEAAEPQSVFQPVECEGTYPQHLQGVCTDGAEAIFWCFTTKLVKTDRAGKMLKNVDVGSHHGDLCFQNGKVFVAVNFGKFNDAKGNADSWVYVYDAGDLSLAARHKTQEVFHGAGGIAFHDGKFLVVGGLPDDVNENYAYEYDSGFKFLKKHVLSGGHTHLGIQTAAFADGHWWFGCYGDPKILLKADASMKKAERFEFDSSLGIVPVGGGKFLVARGTFTKDKGHTGKLVPAEPDKERGLRLVHAGSSTNWPRWRGPNADNVADDRNLPIRWSPTENVRWSAKLPGWGTSSPVVYGKRVFVTSQVEEEGKKSLLLLCFHRDDGQELWRHDFGLGVNQKTHEKSNLAVNTPAVTEDAVYVAFGNADITCYSHEGKLAWVRRYMSDFGDPKMSWGYAVSPLVVDDAVLFPWDHRKGPCFLIGLDKRTGEVTWKKDRPIGTAHATPLFVEHHGQKEILVPGKNRLNVMSWNIRYNNPSDGANAWPKRKDWVAEIIIKSKADISGFQEVLAGQLEDLRVRLPDMESYGVGRDDGKKGGEFVPIFYRKSRFEANDKSTFWLSPTPDKPGSKGWDAAITRIASWVKLKELQTGAVFYVINTHFDHRGAKAQAESAAILVKRLREQFSDHPVILTGDLNSTPKSAPYNTLVGTGKYDRPVFLDAFEHSAKKPEGPTSTWNGFEKIVPNRRIDFVFTTGSVSVLRFQTLDDQREGRFPSDHLPVVAEVEVGKK